MAQKAWAATTRIEYGDPEGLKRVFMPGDIVTGPSKEEMAQLWEAGALEETVVADSGSDAADSTPEGDTPAGVGVDTSSSDVTVVKSATGKPVAAGESTTPTGTGA